MQPLRQIGQGDPLIVDQHADGLDDPVVFLGVLGEAAPAHRRGEDALLAPAVDGVSADTELGGQLVDGIRGGFSELASIILKRSLGALLVFVTPVGRQCTAPLTTLARVVHYDAGNPTSSSLPRSGADPFSVGSAPPLCQEDAVIVFLVFRDYGSEQEFLAAFSTEAKALEYMEQQPRTSGWPRYQTFAYELDSTS